MIKKTLSKNLPLVSQFPMAMLISLYKKKPVIALKSLAPASKRIENKASWRSSSISRWRLRLHSSMQILSSNLLREDKKFCDAEKSRVSRQAANEKHLLLKCLGRLQIETTRFDGVTLRGTLVACMTRKAIRCPGNLCLMSGLNGIDLRATSAASEASTAFT